MTPQEAGALGRIAAQRKLDLIYDQIRTQYEKNPKHCLLCNKEIPYEKRVNIYCSQSCSAKDTNSKFPKREKQKKPSVCIVCGKEWEKWQEHGCRSQKCKICRGPKNTIKTFSDCKGKRSIKKWLLKSRGHRCESCLLSEWLGKQITIELEHIDGDSGNNVESNLKLLCPNCHAQTPTYKGKNRGYGRVSRRQRYREGKSF